MIKNNFCLYYKKMDKQDIKFGEIEIENLSPT